MFLIIVFGLIIAVGNFAIPDNTIKKQIELYEEQPEDSIDIALIGNSSTRAYYDVMTIWDEYGITSMSYAISGMPFDLTIPMIEYVLEDQSPDLFVVELRKVMEEDGNLKYYGMYETSSKTEAYVNALNLFPASIYRIQTILSSNFLEGENYMFWVPLLYNHDGTMDGFMTWIENGFTTDTLDYKQNIRLSYEVSDMTDSYVDFDMEDFDESYTLAEETVERIVELLEYCDEKELNVYFTFSPYINSKHSSDQEARAAIVELVESYGYPVTDYRSEFEEIGLDITTDFRDSSHTNILGANKYTLYAMEDFLEAYDIDTSHDQEVIDDWDATYEDWAVYYDRKIEGLYEDIEALAAGIETSETVDSSDSEYSD